MSNQKLDLEDFFDGDWDGEVLTLTEDFVHEDGSTEQRVWSLTKTGPD